MFDERERDETSRVSVNIIQFNIPTLTSVIFLTDHSQQLAYLPFLLGVKRRLHFLHTFKAAYSDVKMHSAFAKRIKVGKSVTLCSGIVWGEHLLFDLKHYF